MKLVGFGCSFTYGSELVDPEIGTEFHHENTRYRESNVWLGQLAKLLDATWDNRAEPSNSNYAIQYQFTDWFNNSRDSREQVVVCVGWTSLDRMSWLGDKWYHNGFIGTGTEPMYKQSHRDWIINGTDKTKALHTETAKLFVNSVCKLHDIPILQFNVLGVHKPAHYDNYFLDGLTVQSVLKDAQRSDDRLNLFASGGHPNEAGHEYFTIRLHDFAKEHII